MPVQRTILIADRNSNVRSLLRRELERDGYLVTTAKNGEELALLTAHRASAPDLVIMDLDLPLLDGAMSLRAFQDVQPPLPVIIHTAGEYPPGLARYTCVAAFIEKNGDLEELKAAVAAAFDNLIHHSAAPAITPEPTRNRRP